MMAGRPTPARLTLAAASIPRLPRHVRFRHDRTRDRWVLLAPERVLVPDETAVAVLSLVDGARSVGNIAEELAQTYAAPAELILSDSLVLLQDLADKGFVAATETFHA